MQAIDLINERAWPCPLDCLMGYLLIYGLGMNFFRWLGVVIVVNINSKKRNTMKYILLSKLQSSNGFYVICQQFITGSEKGCPSVDLGGPGRPGELDFQAVLEWRKEALTQQWGLVDFLDESIQRVAEMEATVRQRLKSLKSRRR